MWQSLRYVAKDVAVALAITVVLASWASLGVAWINDAWPASSDTGRSISPIACGESSGGYAP